MKSILKQNPLAIAKSSALGLLIGIAVFAHLTSHVGVLVIAVCFFVTVATILRSANKALLLIFVSIVAGSGLIRMLMVVAGLESFPTRVLALIVLLLVLASALVLRKQDSLNHGHSWFFSRSAELLTLAIIVFWLALSSPLRFDPVFYIYHLGEDNGAVLNATARSLESKTLTPSTFSNSGWLTGSIQVLLATITTIGTPIPVGGIEVIDATMRTYALVAALTSVVAGLVLAEAGARRGAQGILLGAWAVIGVTFSAPWIMGTIQWGHFSALVAIMCLQLLLALGQEDLSSLIPQREFFSGVTLILASLSLGGAWYPLQPLSIILSAGFASAVMFAKVRKNQETTKHPVLVAGSLALVITGIVGFSVVSSGYLSRIDETLQLFKTDGAVTRIGQPLLSVLLAGTMWLGIRPSSLSARGLAYSLIGFLTCVSSISYFLGTTPRYGAAKMSLVLLAAACPFVLRAIVLELKVMPRNREHRDALLAVFIGGLTLLVVSAEPYSSLAFMLTKQPSSSNHLGLQAALSDKTQTTICLATEPDYTDYEMYKCSRIALGSQGLHDTSLNAFMRGNLCDVETRELYSIPASTLENLRIVLSNPSRLSAGEGCGRRGWAGEGLDDDSAYLLGWTSAIPWRKVELFDLSGNRVQPSFDYLIGSEDYSDTEIMSLIERLQVG